MIRYLRKRRLGLGLLMVLCYVKAEIDSLSVATLLLGRHPSYHHLWCYNCVFKRPLPPPFHQAICFRMVGNMVSLVDFVSTHSVLPFFGHGQKQYCARQNDKAFSKTTDNRFSRCIICSNKGKSITRIRFYSSKVKAMSFPQRKYTQYAVTLLAGHPQDWCRFLSEVHCWPPHTAAAVTAARSALASRSSCYQVSAQPPSLSPQPLCSWTHWEMTREEMAGERG